MEIRYDRSAKPLDVKPGDLVKVRRKDRKKGRKLRAIFEGPFRVIGYGEHNDNVVVVDIGYGRERHLNVSMVEPYFQRRTNSPARVCLAQAE
jgi:hypothetical protein